ncbi:acyltransferase family protein [Lactiplantibacillus songbeiensis]|uniref:Acyltransferase family protein n=1 Tax=Lactiplantibacillus songbeiensis TaxID=2559920 RepID=A0ABW4C2Y5_9LACO|nr:acyltransferase family protein [Lactiplantibacillus songbeiensis]
MSKRIQWIDVAKGIGILLVVYGHALGGIMNADQGGNTNILQVLYNIIYGFHMPLFFFLSGIFARNWVKRAVGIALRQKITSLVIPYFIWTVITGSIMALAQKYTNSGLGIRNILLSPVAPFSEYWFLYVLFVTFVVYYFGVRLFGEQGILGIAVIFFLLRPFIYHYWIFDAFSLNFVFFCIGTEVFELNQVFEFLEYSKKKVLLAVLLFIIINVMNLAVLKTNNYMAESYTKALTVIIGVLLIVYIAQWLEHFPKLTTRLAWLGRASMAIYVMHLIPIAGSRIIALNVLKINSLFLLSITISIIALTMCLIGYYLLEKTKIGRLSFGEGLKTK